MVVLLFILFLHEIGTETTGRIEVPGAGLVLALPVRFTVLLRDFESVIKKPYFLLKIKKVVLECDFCGNFRCKDPFRYILPCIK